MASSDVVILDGESFDRQVLEAEGPVLVDFWAPWCGPCRAVAPALVELAGEYSGRVKVAKLNIDEAPRVARRFGVRSIPTLAVFRGGEIVKGLVGAASKAQLAALLDSVLGSGDGVLAAS